MKKLFLILLLATSIPTIANDVHHEECDITTHLHHTPNVPDCKKCHHVIAQAQIKDVLSVLTWQQRMVLSIASAIVETFKDGIKGAPGTFH